MRTVETWIPMNDGVRLAVTLFQAIDPAHGSVEPQPVILEALPYRKDDATASYRAEYQRLVEQGRYHVARVDIRGTGSSEGIAADEYTEREQHDLEAVISWLAAQPWSTGTVGMYGTSYSGFNSLQLAARRPAALAAVIAIYATDDRFTDDVHYSGGALRAIDLVDYCHYMTAFNALPPVPRLFGAGWRNEWRRRVDGTEPWLLRWLREQVDSPYWRHGSLRSAASGPGRESGYERIACPTMIVAGWADGYRNNSLRTYARLTCEKALLFGPWSHMSPAHSLPGPHLDLVPEMLAWWDRWLRGRDVLEPDPPIRVFVKHATKPEPDLAVHAGEWRFLDGWPVSEHTSAASNADVPVVLRAADARHNGEGQAAVWPRGGVGAHAWISCAGALPWGQPLDQRPDDVFSLCLDWPVGAAALTMLGHPVLRTRVRTDAAVAQLSAKLESVFADGTSALVARGLLNLAHRDSMADPTPVPVGEWVDLTLELEIGSWCFPVDHHIRLALAGSDWPNNWMAPTTAPIEVDLAATTLTLPAIAASDPAARRPEFADAHGVGRTGQVSTGDPHDEEDPRHPAPLWRYEHDVLAREIRAITRYGSVSDSYEDDYRGEVTVKIDDPAVGTANATTRISIRWPEATVTSEARLRFRSDATTYQVEIELDVDEDGVPFARRTWCESIPRHLQ